MDARENPKISKNSFKRNSLSHDSDPVCWLGYLACAYKNFSNTPQQLLVTRERNINKQSWYAALNRATYAALELTPTHQTIIDKAAEKKFNEKKKVLAAQAIAISQQVNHTSLDNPQHLYSVSQTIRHQYQAVKIICMLRSVCKDIMSMFPLIKSSDLSSHIFSFLLHDSTTNMLMNKPNAPSVFKAPSDIDVGTISSTKKWRYLGISCAIFSASVAQYTITETFAPAIAGALQVGISSLVFSTGLLFIVGNLLALVFMLEALNMDERSATSYFLDSTP